MRGPTAWAVVFLLLACAMVGGDAENSAARSQEQLSGPGRMVMRTMGAFQFERNAVPGDASLLPAMARSWCVMHGFCFQVVGWKRPWSSARISARRSQLTGASPL